MGGSSSRYEDKQDANEICFLLVGRTGDGKSATGNSILKSQEFKPSSGTKSQTKKVTVAWANHCCHAIKVVDSPGLRDTDLSRTADVESAIKNMTKTLYLCNGGVHAILLVLKFGNKFTYEVRETLSDLKNIFGQNYLKERGIIVVTGGDNFHATMKKDGTPDRTFDQWARSREQSEDFKQLLRECGSRIVLFNNFTDKEEEKEAQIKKLLSHADEMRKRGLYTSKHFNLFQQIRQKQEVKDTLILKEDFQRNVSLFINQLACFLVRPTLQDTDSLRTVIQELLSDIIKSRDKHKLKDMEDTLKQMQMRVLELKSEIEKDSATNINSHIDALKDNIASLKKAATISFGQKFMMFIKRIRKKKGSPKMSSALLELASAVLEDQAATTTIQLILIGRSGGGKSATGNSILGEKLFATSSSTKLETTSVKFASARHDCYDIKVVDTPGLTETNLSRTEEGEQAVKNMTEALRQCDDPAHAIVLAIRLGDKFTPKLENTLSDLKKVFGENYLTDRGIIVVTGGDNFADMMKNNGTPGLTFKEWVNSKEPSEHFKQLVRECGSRIVLFDNFTEEEEEQESQRIELFVYTEELKRKYAG